MGEMAQNVSLLPPVSFFLGLSHSPGCASACLCPYRYSRIQAACLDLSLSVSCVFIFIVFMYVFSAIRCAQQPGACFANSTQMRHWSQMTQKEVRESLVSAREEWVRNNGGGAQKGVSGAAAGHTFVTTP